MKNTTLNLANKNIWDSNNDSNGIEYFYMAFDGSTFENKETIKSMGFTWNDVYWVKRIEAKKENITELASVIKNAVENGAEFESLIRGLSYEMILKTAGIN